jgi:hypothetical protein
MKSLLRSTALLAALGLSSCGGDVGVGFGYVWIDDHPWPNHPDWPSWPDHPQGATGLYPIAGDICGVCSGSKDGTGPAARFNAPEGIAADTAGNLYVAEPASATVRKITPQGVVTTLAGAIGAVGYADGAGSAARFNMPSRLDTDAQGNVYLTDSGNSVVRKITASGEVTSLAGNGTCGSADGRERSAQFCNPKGIALDHFGTCGSRTPATTRCAASTSTATSAPWRARRACAAAQTGAATRRASAIRRTSTSTNGGMCMWSTPAIRRSA